MRDTINNGTHILITTKYTTKYFIWFGVYYRKTLWYFKQNPQRQLKDGLRSHFIEASVVSTSQAFSQWEQWEHSFHLKDVLTLADGLREYLIAAAIQVLNMWIWVHLLAPRRFKRNFIWVIFKLNLVLDSGGISNECHLPLLTERRLRRYTMRVQIKGQPWFR